jgi:glycosyltransferase involved in cell wall biosynthesis
VNGRPALSILSVGIVSASDVAGGAEAHTVALGRGLRARGHDVVLYGRCPGWAEETLSLHPLQLGPKWSRTSLVTGLLRVPVERRRARAVPQHSVYSMQFKREQISLTKSVSSRGPVVWTEHGRWMRGGMGQLLLRGYARAARRVAKVVCVSAAVADDVRLVVPAEKVIVIPNAIDTASYEVSPSRRARAREDLLPERLRDRTVAVLASRLHGAKRHDRAIAVALATGTPLIVIGDGPDRGRLERLVAGSPEVMFLGHRDDVSNWMAAADVYLYCGAETDGTPTAVLEAAASGLPIVGFRGDPGTELIQECGGVVVADPRHVTTDMITSMARQRGLGVSYAQRRHGIDAWLDAYEGIFRECAG